MKTAIVVQARTGSTRLPNKVLLPVAGAPMLVRMLERIEAASSDFELVVATTVDPADDAVRELAKGAGVRCVSGHPTDLLERHLLAAREVRADVVVKIPSDCPLIDPAIVDRVLSVHRAHAEEVDFASNLHPATYPDGNDVEVIPTPILELAGREAKRPHEREHTTPFIWDQPGRFRLMNVTWDTGLDYSMSHRLTVDYREDYELVRAIYDELYDPSRPAFSLAEILALLERRPEFYAINAKYAGVNWYRHHIGELRTVGAAETRRITSD